MSDCGDFYSRFSVYLSKLEAVEKLRVSKTQKNAQKICALLKPKKEKND